MSSLLLFISILLLFTTICFSSRIPIRSDYEVSLLYEGWLVRHNKFYSDSSEKERRYEIFKDNLKYIDKHNAGNHTYTLALNVFADLTVEEYRATYLRTLPHRKWRMENDSEAFNDNVGVAPDSIDWRDEGVINPIRHQGGCCKYYCKNYNFSFYYLFFNLLIAFGLQFKEGVFVILKKLIVSKIIAEFYVRRDEMIKL